MTQVEASTCKEESNGTPCRAEKLSPLEIAKELASNSHALVSSDNNAMVAFLVSHDLLSYLKGGGDLPHGGAVIAIYRKDLIDGGRFERAKTKPLPFTHISYFMNPEDDPFAESLRRQDGQTLKRMAFTADSAEALLATLGDMMGAKVHWEQNNKHQYGIDVTLSFEEKLAIGLQPKMTERPPYTKNIGWRKEKTIMASNMGKLKQYNYLIRNAECTHFIAVSNAEISPQEIRRLRQAGIGHFYLHSYRID